MEKGSIVGSIDTAQVVLYAFWVFFLGLVFYLRREDKREGYPLVTERAGVFALGFPVPPSPKVFKLTHGGTAMAPNGRPDAPVTAATPVAPWPGAPLEPTGNPMLDGIGPGSWANRADHPDLTLEGVVKIVPLRVATSFTIAEGDPDPRGMTVIGGDRGIAGTIRDVWVDRSEVIIRYYEVELPSGARKLLPANFSRVDRRRGTVTVRSILAKQFADVPDLKNPDQITLLEEDKVCAYYGGGTLYATAARAEPLL
ncbi:MAG: photosynthetic reaction center subunit H [Pseudorhodoplanes sp.]|nr:photosynthetic reaction center subunit H [Pseudorhodoplanes sp.]